MSNFEQRKLEILQDINKVVKAIDDEVDAFIVSRMHPNPMVKKIVNEVFERRAANTTHIAKEMTQKYD